MPALDRHVPDDVRPGEPDQVGAAVPVPNTHRSFLNGLNMPKYRPTIQCLGLLGWLCLAHLQVSLHMWASSLL